MVLSGIYINIVRNSTIGELLQVKHCTMKIVPRICVVNCIGDLVLRSYCLCFPQVGLAQMLKGGVIMDVVNVEQARIAEEAGACAVMALERVPADIRKDGGVARMSDPGMIKAIKEAVTIPVMAKARIGHFVEAQILESLEIDYIDESEVLQLIQKNWGKCAILSCRDL